MFKPLKLLKFNFSYFILILIVTFLILTLYVPGWGGPSQLANLKEKDLIVLTGREGYDDFERQLERFLGNIGTERYRERKLRFDEIKTPAQFEEYRKERLSSFLAGIGPFPERTALNVKHYGRIDCGDYLIEKITYESRPNYLVTANLYVPARHSPPWPIVLCPHGHSIEGRNANHVQQRCVALARRGYLTLTFDSFGQGERRSYFDPSLKWKSKIGKATDQHAYLNYQLHLTGHNMTNFFIWDGIRALDYLCSRDDVDNSRIAVTGCSGGGNQTRLITAADSRVKAAIPVVSNYYRGIDYRPGRGNPDGDQNVPGLVRYGIECVDQVIMSQATGVLIMNATGDRGTIMQSVNMFNEINDMFTRVCPDRIVSYRLIGDEHGYSRDYRENMYGWLNRHFGKNEETYIELPIKLRTDEELNITRSGTVEELGSETLLTLNRKYVDEVAPAPVKINSKKDFVAFKNDIRGKIRKLLNLKNFPYGSIQSKSFEILKGEDFTMEKIAFSSEEGIWIPGLFFTPRGNEPDEFLKSPVVLYIHERGKANGLENIINLVMDGLRVFAIDARGFKEVPDPHPVLENIDNVQPERICSKLIYGDRDSGCNAYCYQLEQSLFGMKLLDVMAAIDYLNQRSDVDSDNISIYGYGDGAMLALHAAVLDERIKTIGLNKTLISFRTLASEPFWSHSPFLFIHGILANYDVPELLTALGGREVMLANTVGALRQVLEEKYARESYNQPLKVFRILKAEKKLWIGNMSDTDFAERFTGKIN
ncbi:acetylxylan esterase [candidate division KSB1 bacterium]